MEETIDAKIASMKDSARLQYAGAIEIMTSKYDYWNRTDKDFKVG